MTAAEKQNQPPARRQEKDRTWQNWLKQESSNHDEKSIAKRDIARDNNGGIWYCISANECTDRPGRVAPVEFATPQPPSIIDSTAFSPTVEDSHETQTYSSRTLVVNRDIQKDHCTIAPSQRILLKLSLFSLAIYHIIHHCHCPAAGAY
ncbi:hypothetical protein DTO027B5_3118 [Paecilomyces variotii]|nr:hypothetical protein DTO021C3_7087 [Paecilomyces variotii]KAJ9320259.1 hypothetical protein DTO027B3_8730 [Paecilomyces variotii]KAJ9335155.1 hypothetical protein DTO027B5_3118 [Paecilomyces variotii]